MPAAIAIAVTTIAAALVARHRRDSRTRTGPAAVFLFGLDIDAEKLYRKKTTPRKRSLPGRWSKPMTTRLELELHADSQDARGDDLIDSADGSRREISVLCQDRAGVEDVEGIG